MRAFVSTPECKAQSVCVCVCEKKNKESERESERRIRKHNANIVCRALLRWNFIPGLIVISRV